MIQIFFVQNGETKFMDISPEAHEKLRIYSFMTGLPIQEVAKAIVEKFGDISEESVVNYINSATARLT